MQETANQFLYSTEEQSVARDAMEARFGPISGVLREMVSPDIRVDLCVIDPGPGRPYQTIVTCGMGARDMPTPPELRGFARAELLFMLPPDWDIRSRDECRYWPLRWLKLLARLPWEEDSWLGWGHTVPNGEPFAENTDFSAVLLLDPYLSPQQQAGEACAFQLPGESGATVRFYQCFALYEEELRYQLDHGAQALLERFTEQNLLMPVLQLGRPNLFPAPPAANSKRLLLAKHQLQPLLPDWEGPADCLATDRIVVDGAPVGYCYREAPAGDWDSGWRFTAGDESDDYMDDPRRSDIYSLNCLANYDADILPILSTPAPCAFARGAHGLTRLKNIR